MTTNTATKNYVKLLKDVLAVTKQVGIDTIIIENGLVRGSVADMPTFVMHRIVDTGGVPAACINRPSALNVRVGAFDDSATISYTTATASKNQVSVEYIREFTIKHGKAKVTYRCGNPMLVEIPRGVRSNFEASAVITSDMLPTIMKAKAAMGSSTIQLAWADDLIATMYDNSNDEFTVPLTAAVDAPEGFSVTKSYSLDHVVSVLKLWNGTDAASMEVTTKGSLKMTVGEYTFYIIPEASNV